MEDPRGVQQLLEDDLPYRELEGAAVPLHVVTTDVLGGVVVRLSTGPAVEAVLASCAIPAAFPPVRFGERYLMDGAVASNTPIRVAMELGASRLIVLPTGYACALESPPLAVSPYDFSHGGELIEGSRADWSLAGAGRNGKTPDTRRATTASRLSSLLFRLPWHHVSRVDERRQQHENPPRHDPVDEAQGAAKGNEVVKRKAEEEESQQRQKSCYRHVKRARDDGGHHDHLRQRVQNEAHDAVGVGGADGTRTRDPRRDRPVF